MQAAGSSRLPGIRPNGQLENPAFATWLASHHDATAIGGAMIKQPPKQPSIGRITPGRVTPVPHYQAFEGGLIHPD
jgi:hypothetical protein